ncbi:MAG: ABC transporter permease [Pseudomonadota bacterium]
MNFFKAREGSLDILVQMGRRSILQRYRGSWLGIGWAFLTPLFMLFVYTFIFTRVFTVRWGQDVGGGNVGELGTFEFAVVLFAGLSVYTFFSEVVLSAAGVIPANTNYVKKVIFPLRVLPIVELISAAFQLIISLIILLIFQYIITQNLPLTTLLAPIVLLPLIIMMAGLSWLLAGLGVYLRDITQILAPLVTALLFLGPILYPATSFAPEVRPWLVLNPVTVPVEALRDLVIWGVMPDWVLLGQYSLVAILIFVVGWALFSRMRPGFADVL